MGRVKVMDQELANLIAAGEVIERPASVVKELVENSLDAGAGKVVIEIERAGSRLISVTDDGCGMDEEDARNALELHGTSKLIRAEDIGSIETMGFRGEALPSMAQVSKFVMRTRCSDASEGLEVVVEGGRIQHISPCGAPPGTSVRVENLFFNTPARKKFMKSPATEEHHIEEAVTLLALANPDTAFELRIDRKVVFRLAKSTRSERMRELFGRQGSSEMIEVAHKEGSLGITGFIGTPGFTRSSRREQRFFVNRRPVDSLTIARALRDGYATLTEPGRYVPAVLFLELPVDEIDINVHPAKREIRFRSEFTIVRAVAAAVSNALRNWGAGVPARMPDEKEFSAEKEKEKSFEIPEVPLVPQEKEPVREAAVEKTPGQLPPGVKFFLESSVVTYSVEKKGEQPELGFESEEPLPPDDVPDGNRVVKLIGPVEKGFQKEKISVPVTSQLTKRDEIPYREPEVPRSEMRPRGFWPEKVLGIYDNTYLLAAGVEGLLLIDQHAAHERVMFEKLLDSWQRNTEGLTQGLLIPETLELPRGLLALLTRNLDFFQQLGFDFVPAGRNTVIVNGLPLNLKVTRPLGELVVDLLNGLLDEDYTPGDLEAVARAACHAAVRAHDELTLQGAEKLLEELKNCRQGTLCPHGRPTMITLSLREIEKRFGRR